MLKSVKFALIMVLTFGLSSAWSARLVDEGDGSVRDFDTGLSWQKTDDNTVKTYAAAITYCDGLTLAGKSDWRLPSPKELNSIVDYRVPTPSPTIDTDKFPSTKSWEYWSASSYASNSAGAWRVHFDHGGVDAVLKTGSYYVRCVR